MKLAKAATLAVVASLAMGNATSAAAQADDGVSDPTWLDAAISSYLDAPISTDYGVITPTDQIGATCNGHCGGSHTRYNGLFETRCPHCCEPTWYVEANVLFLNRTRPRVFKIVEDQNQSSPAPPRGQRQSLLTTGRLRFGYEWGPGITLGRRLGPCRGISLTYFGIPQWDAGTALSSTDVPANLSMPFDSNYTSDFNGATNVAVTYTSQLHSFEANYLVSHGPILTGLIGFRYLNLDEEFDYRSTDDGETSDYLIDTANSLVGCQFGGIVDRQVNDRFGWNFDLKAGLYVNISRQRTWLGDDDNTVVLRDYVVDEGELAFLGQISLGLVYRLTACATLTAGYQIAWLDGVALAPEQLDFTTTAASGQTLNDDGNVFFDGGYVGLGITR